MRHLTILKDSVEVPEWAGLVVVGRRAAVDNDGLITTACEPRKPPRLHRVKAGDHAVRLTACVLQNCYRNLLRSVSDAALEAEPPSTGDLS